MEARAREREERGKSRGLWWREEFVVVADVTRNEGLFSCDMQRKLPPRIVAHNSTVHDRGMQNKSISRSLISLSLNPRSAPSPSPPQQRSRHC